MGFPGDSAVKHQPASAGDTETWVWSLSWEDPLEEEIATGSNILPWESYRQRSLLGYSPWGNKESDTTEQPRMHREKLRYSSISQSIFQQTPVLHEINKFYINEGFQAKEV